jgi:hypothetical protein
VFGVPAAHTPPPANRKPIFFCWGESSFADFFSDFLPFSLAP